jgi:hypothetical protein
MLFVYGGKSNSIPGVSTFATSAPLPPVGPPAAVGDVAAILSGNAVAVRGIGVASFGAGRGFGADFRALAGMTGVARFGDAGVETFSTLGAGGRSWTVPAARSPWGAATI